MTGILQVHLGGDVRSSPCDAVGPSGDADCSTLAMSTDRSDGSSTAATFASSHGVQRGVVPPLSLKLDSTGSEGPRSDRSDGSDSDGSHCSAYTSSQCSVQRINYGALREENLEVGDDAQVFSIATPTSDKIKMTPGMEVFAMISPRSDKEASSLLGEPSCAEGSKSTLAAKGTQMKAMCCPAGHELQYFQTPIPGYSCSTCDEKFPAETMLHSCRQCDYDLCDKCMETAKASALCRSALSCVSKQEEQRKKVEMWLNSECKMGFLDSATVTDVVSNNGAHVHEEPDFDHVSWESSSIASADSLQDMED